MKIATSLGCLHNAEGIFLLRYGQIIGVIAGNLQKDSGVGTAFVSLSGGVQKARAKTKTRSYMLAVTYCMADQLKLLFMVGIHLNVAKQGKIIASAKLIEMSTEK